MIVNLEKKDAATLCLHMNIMRDKFKKLLKKKYKQEQDDYMSAYRYVIKQCTFVLENAIEHYEMHLNISDLQVLEEFLRAYTVKVDNLFTQVDVKKAGKEDAEQLERLRKLHGQCKELLSDAA